MIINNWETWELNLFEYLDYFGIENIKAPQSIVNMFTDSNGNYNVELMFTKLSDGIIVDFINSIDILTKVELKRLLPVTWTNMRLAVYEELAYRLYNNKVHITKNMSQISGGAFTYTQEENEPLMMIDNISYKARKKIEESTIHNYELVERKYNPEILATYARDEHGNFYEVKNYGKENIWLDTI